MIVSASRRTDLPAFHAPWLMERVAAGFCEVVNPYRRDQRSLVSLKPCDVDCFVFWTRAPAGLLGRLPELRERGFRWYFLYTLLDYPPAFEPRLPPLDRRLDLLRAAAATVPRGGVVWRYDPVILSSATPVSFHLETFERLATRLEGVVDRVIVSLVDFYAKTKRGFEEMRREGVAVASEAEHLAARPGLFSALARIALRYGMSAQSCAEKTREDLGVEPGQCIDHDLIQRLWGTTVSTARDRGQRGACRCAASRDIGAYDTCLHGCRYCYATSRVGRSREVALARRPGALALADGA